MGDSSRVTVKIYGQEYTIAGGDSGDRVVVVANHVDSMMNELAEGLHTRSASSLAVLTAVNVTNDYFDARDRVSELENTITGLRKDSEHYIQLWEEVKASFKQYKEDSKNDREQLQELQRIFNMKNLELNEANEAKEELRQENDSLRQELMEEREKSRKAESSLESLKNLQSQYESVLAENSRLKAGVQELESKRSSESQDASEVQEKYKELESSFFDIQMENLQLKNELDNLRKNRQ